MPIHELPLFNEDIESKGSTKSVGDFLERCNAKNTDGFIFAVNYNGSISAPLKNALDWGSRRGNLFDDKPCAIIGARGYVQELHEDKGTCEISPYNLNMKDMRGGFGSGLEIRLQTTDTCAFDADGNLVNDFWKEMIADKTIPGFISWIKRLDVNKADI